MDNFAVAILDCPPPVVSAVSRKVHGGAGTFDVNLPLSGSPGVECRSGPSAGAFQIVATFASPVTVGSASITSGVGAIGNASANGTVVTVDLTGVTNAQTITISLNGVSDGTTTGNVPVTMGVLAGDTTGNGTVNATDVGQTKSQSGGTPSSGNFRVDVNASGSNNATDVSLVKSRSGTTLTP